MAALSHNKTQDASTPPPPKDESILQKAARIIPGLSSSSSSSPQPTNKPKARSRKAKISAPVHGSGVTIGKEGEPSSLAPPAQAQGGQAGQSGQLGEEEGDDQIEAKKTSAVEATSKRIRAANKKLQRIATYEEKTEALNADQRTAVASKPALQAVVKELEELLVILKAEETEDDARNKRVAAQQEKKNARSLSLAVAEHTKSSHSDLTVLLQFLHLHELYAPPSAEMRTFAPPPLPPVVANATGNEVGAVRCLREAFATAPLAPGGYEEVKEKLSKLAKGSDEYVILNVTYGRVKELLDGLNAPTDPTPATPLATSPTAGAESSSPSGARTLPIPESSAPAGAADSVTALVDGATETPNTRSPTTNATAGGPSFLNASELDLQQVPSSEEKVASWADEVPAAAPPAVAPQSHTQHAAPAPPPPQTNGTPSAAADWSAPPTGAAAAAPIDWSSEDNHNELPSLPELAAQPTPTAAPAAGGDGFQTQQRGGNRRGGGGGFEGGRGGGPRGGFRGGEGRGSFRGGPGRGRGGGYQGERREGGGGYQGGERREGGGAPAEGQWQRGPREGGEFRGGRGGGGGRGRPEGRGGRGSFRGAPPANGEAPAAAAPAPAVL